MKFTKVTSLVIIGATVLAMTGCNKNVSIDVGALDDIDDGNFYDALESIDVSKDDCTVMEDNSFTMGDDDSVYYDVDLSIDAYTDNCYYSYVKCVDEDTAHDLFDYYYDNLYHDILENTNGKFSGAKGSSISSDSDCYIALDGEFEDDDSYSVYHDLVILKGDVLLIAYIDVDDEDQVDNGKAEIDTFLDALGYPKP